MHRMKNLSRMAEGEKPEIHRIERTGYLTLDITLVYSSLYLM